MTQYDSAFNQNEWFVMILLLFGYTLVFFLRKTFRPSVMLFFLSAGVFIAIFFDHTLSLDPMNYYDVNDTSKYEIFDFISYIMFGPYAFLFIYSWEKFSLKKKHAAFYILGCSLLSIGLEWLAFLLGVFHYRMGYKIYYSFPIYLSVQAVFLYFYLNFIQKLIRGNQ